MKLLVLVWVACFLVLGVSLAGEVWIVQTAGGNLPGGNGTRANPFTVPVGDNTAYDAIIGSLSPNTAVHIGAGTFLTKGSHQNGSGTVNRLVPSGSALYGSGPGITIIKVADSSWPSGTLAGVALQFATSAPADGYHGTVKDLTVDVNFAGQHSSTQKSTGLGGSGYMWLVENVEVVNLGCTTAEAFGIFIGNLGMQGLDQASYVTIRNCKVHKPWPDSSSGISAICPTGNNAWNGVVEGCYVDLSAAPNSQRSAISFAGAPRGLVIAHNTAIGAYRGIHADTPGMTSPQTARNVIIQSNKIGNCIQGIGIGTDGLGQSLPEDAFVGFTIASNAIEMTGAGTGIALWGNTRGFLVINNTIVKHPEAPLATFRTGIFLASGTEGHRVVGNRFGPDWDPDFLDVNPALYSQTAASGNHFEDNTWIDDKALPKSFNSVRAGTGMPAGTALWHMTLGGAQSDANPTSVISSSDLDGGNAYDFVRFSRAAGGFASGYNTVFDPAGVSGVYIGDDNSGELAVGGWVTAKSGLFLDAGARLKIAEAGGRMGTATLVAGQAVVTTSQVSPYSRIFLTPQQDGGTPGAVRVSTRTDGVSFVITSSSPTDGSVVAWLIVDP